MSKLYSFLLVFIYSCCFLASTHAQRPGLRTAKDTVVVVFCSSRPVDLNTGATLEAAKKNLLTLDSSRFSLDIDDKTLVGDNFTPANLQRKVNYLRTLGPRTRVIFHFFDHGRSIGGKIPAIESPYMPARNGMPGVINIQEAVIEPLIGSQLGFVMVLADACNAIEVSGSGSEKSEEREQTLSIEQMNKVLADSRKEAKAIRKESRLKSKMPGAPLGLMRSSTGWIAISTAGWEQKAFYSKDFGGYGSAIFFDLLVNDEGFQRNWEGFLDEYRRRVQSVKRRKQGAQIPIWEGKINGIDVAEDSLVFPFRALKEEEVNALLEKDRSDIKREELRTLSQSTAEDFCTKMNETSTGRSLDPELTRLCVRPDDLPIFNDLDLAYGRTSRTGYVALANYRGRRGSETSLYLPDSLRLGREWVKRPAEDKIYVSYRAAKRVKGPQGVDTVVQQLIFLEVQPEIRFVRRVLRGIGNLLRKNDKSDEAPLLVSHVYNVPGKIRPPVPPKKDPVVVPVPKDTVPPPPAAEDYFLERAEPFLRAFYGVIERAANHRQNKTQKEDLLSEVPRFFLHPDSASFVVSNLNKPKETVSPADFCTRSWTKFDGQYDSVHYHFQQPLIPRPGNDGFVTKLAPDRWVADVRYEQWFEGYQRGRVVYEDITVKIVRIWIFKEPNPAPGQEPYRMLMGPVDVEKTERVPAELKKNRHRTKTAQP